MLVRFFLLFLLLTNFNLLPDDIGNVLKVTPDDLFQRLLAENNVVKVIETKVLDGVTGYCISYEPDTVEVKNIRRRLWVWVPMGNAFYLDNLNYGLIFIQGGGLVYHKPVVQGFETHLLEALRSGVFVFHVDYSMWKEDLLYPMQIREWLMALNFIKKNFRLKSVVMAGESAGAEACSMLFARFNFSDYKAIHARGIKMRSYTPVVMAGDDYFPWEEHILLLKEKEISEPYIKGISVLSLPSDMTMLDPVEFDFRPYFGVSFPSEEIKSKYSSINYYNSDENKIFRFPELVIQTFHGTKDMLVPVEVARNFFRNLYYKGFPIIYSELDADHSLLGNFDKAERVHMSQFSFLRAKVFPEFRHENVTLVIERNKTLIYECLNVRLKGISFKGKVRIYRYNSRGTICVFSGFLEKDNYDDSYVNQNQEDETGYIVTKVYVLDGKEVESRY